MLLPAADAPFRVHHNWFALRWQKPVALGLGSMFENWRNQMADFGAALIIAKHPKRQIPQSIAGQ